MEIPQILGACVTGLGIPLHSKMTMAGQGATAKIFEAGRLHQNSDAIAGSIEGFLDDKNTLSKIQSHCRLSRPFSNPKEKSVGHRLGCLRLNQLGWWVVEIRGTPWNPPSGTGWALPEQ